MSNPSLLFGPGNGPRVFYGPHLSNLPFTILETGLLGARYTDLLHYERYGDSGQKYPQCIALIAPPPLGANTYPGYPSIPYSES
jgi:hypothetical protein